MPIEVWRRSRVSDVSNSNTFANTFTDPSYFVKSSNTRTNHGSNARTDVCADSSTNIYTNICANR